MTRVYTQILSASTMLRQAVELDLRRHGLTLAQFEILARLAESPDGLRMADLAELMIASRGGMTYRIGQLEKSGLVERAQVEGDDRGVIARLTPAGAAALKSALPDHAGFVAAMMPPELVDELERSLPALEMLELRARRALFASDPGLD